MFGIMKLNTKSHSEYRNYNTGNKMKNFYLPKHILKGFTKNTSNAGVTLWKYLPKKLTDSEDKNIFKTKLKEMLIEKVLNTFYKFYCMYPSFWFLSNIEL